jgi:hypothetical protein
MTFKRLILVPLFLTASIAAYSEEVYVSSGHDPIKSVNQRCKWDLAHDDPDDLVKTLDWGNKKAANDVERATEMTVLSSHIAQKAFEKWPDNRELATSLKPYILNDKDLK